NGDITQTNAHDLYPLHNQFALHRGVGAPATADIAVERKDARLIWCEGSRIAALWWSNNTHAEFVDSPLMLAATVRMVRAVHAGEPHGDRLAHFDPNFFRTEPVHRRADVNRIGGGSGRFRREGRNEQIA